MLILGIVSSAFWAGSFASSFLRQGIILSNVAIPPSGFISSTIQLTDITHQIALQVLKSSRNIRKYSSSISRLC
jgi:hypothetical protein